MVRVKPDQSTSVWRRRREVILRELAKSNGQVPKDELLRRLSNTLEFTKKGRDESELQSPAYYFRYAALKLTDQGFIEFLQGSYRLTDAGREEVAPAAEQQVRTVDSKSRLLLPKDFANATVTIDHISRTEIRIRKAIVVPADELPLVEDQLKPLSDRDRDLFIELLDNPPEPTPALQKALKLHKKRHG